MQRHSFVSLWALIEPSDYRYLMQWQARASRMVDAAALISGSSFFISAVLNELVTQIFCAAFIF